MTTAVDTNIFVALLARTDRESSGARRSLKEARERGALVISAPVHAELPNATPGRAAAWRSEAMWSAGEPDEETTVPGASSRSS